MSSLYESDGFAYESLFNSVQLPDEMFEQFDVAMPDDVLDKLLIRSLNENIDYWNQEPWRLQEGDEENVKYYLGDQVASQGQIVRSTDQRHIDNRLFAGVRAILSYATGQLAIPEVTPSKSDDQYIHMARAIQQALYEHAGQNKVEQKTRAAVTNLLIRKRGYLKLRYDPNAGTLGDIVTEVCNPEDIIFDRYAVYGEDPNIIYHRIRCSIDQLCDKYPNKKAQILQSYKIKQGRWSQVSKYVTYFEAWFTYYDSQGHPLQGLCAFLPEFHLILEKGPNPNWIYTGNYDKDKQENVLTMPPKPFVWFNYLTLGHSAIDETSLFEQAKPVQDSLNTRLRQFNENVDYATGRWIGSKKAMTESDGTKMVNKGPKTIGLVDAEDVNKAFANVASQPLPIQVYQSIEDSRNEIDVLMGTPSVFRGAQPNTSDTLGRDMMVKQQAGMLQDDLVRAVANGMANYYNILLQMMRVYYTDDYWFQVKGNDGKFDFIMLNGDNIDSNVKIGVQVDSTLPLDKASIRATAMSLAQMNRIDPLTLMEDLGLPNPEARTERLLRSQIDLYTYMQSVETSMDNNDAEVDIMLIVAGKQPEERDTYDENYINYFNHFITMNRFAMLPQDAKQRVVQFLQAITQKAQQTATLQESMLNDAGIINRSPIFPLPKRTLNIRLQGAMNPQQTSQIAGNEAGMFTPVSQAQQAQDPTAQQAPAAQGAATQAQPQQ